MKSDSHYIAIMDLVVYLSSVRLANAVLNFFECLLDLES